MVDIVADFHLHSKFSRAVSPQMTLPMMAHVAKQKGIDLLATGDWTHPLWLKEIKSYLTEAEEGLYKIKSQKPGAIPAKAGIQSFDAAQDKEDGSRIKSGMTNEKEEKEIRFLLSVEIASIYSEKGKGRRVHNLVLAPSFSTAEKINLELLKRGCNLSSDGRPIIGLSCRNLLELILSIDERTMIIPCHAWTPWFGVYGQMSGFDSLSQAFGDLSDKVYAIETGISSDPEMNWQIKELETRSILSFSDAHSLAKMGREATVFRLESLNYENMRQAIMAPSLRDVIASKAKQSSSHKEIAASSMIPRNDGLNRVLYTIEFYPEEGKYHYSGHRKCGVFYAPEEIAAKGNICPVCKRKLTDGVMRRVQELASENVRGTHEKNQHGLVWIQDPKKIHPPFVKLVPLLEIIAESLGRPITSPRVKELFTLLCEKVGSELDILLKVDLPDIAKVGGNKVAEGVKKVREENIVITPGFDGVYGTVKIWEKGEDVAKDVDQPVMAKDVSQMGIDF